MIELTAGYVAGVIAFGIVVAQLWCPNALTFFLAGQIHDRETAATWTVAGRSLQNSLWPTLLRADASKTKGVRKSVRLTTMCVPLIGLLISIAGVVTPLGLYELDEPDTESSAATFQYVPDSSAFRMGTSPRNNKPFTRTCNYSPRCYMPCPYTSDVMVYETDGSSSSCDMKYGINATVPDILQRIYGSGTNNRRTTISNFFDIEWRQMTEQYDRSLNNGTPVTKGTFRFLESLALGGDLRAVEGLVVDGRNGSIGFRNHTLPVGLNKGATWSEDLLFLEPDAECVNTNVTLDFEISTSVGGYSSQGGISSLHLTDRGGFVNINTTYPVDKNQTTTNVPNLKQRAYQAAWFTNGLTMMYMDITDPTDKVKGTKAYDRIDSKLNQKWEIPIPYGDQSDFQTLDINTLFSKHLGLTATDTNGTEWKKLYKNPHNVTDSEFNTARTICQGTRVNAPVKFNNTFVTCSFVRGVPQRTNSGPKSIFDDGSRWSSPIYTCAASVKATIKTVTFFHNGTSTDLDQLVVQSVRDKEYKSDNEMPLWGVEDWGHTLSQVDPIWGIVDSAFEGYRNVTTLRAPSLHMLGFPGDGVFTNHLIPNSPMMNLAGAIGPNAILQSVATSGDELSPTFDYNAKSSMSLWMKWQELSASEDTMPDVLKLLWTDLASSALVGTKGVLGHYNAKADSAANIRVLPTVHRVKYRWAFGIPAVILLIMMGFIFLAVFLSTITGRASFANLSHRLKQVAVGRLLTTIFHPDSSSFMMTPADWGKANAEKPMSMATGRPMPDREGGPPPPLVNNGSQPFNGTPPQGPFQKPGAFFPLQQQAWPREQKPYFPEPK